MQSEEAIIKVPKLCGSVRLNVIIGLFAALFISVWMGNCMFIGLVCMTGTDNNATDAGYIEGEFKHWDRETEAHILMSFFFGVLTTQVLGGYIVDRFGEKVTLICSIATYSSLSLLLPTFVR